MHYKKNDLKFQIPYYLLSVRNKKLLWMYRSNSPHTEQSEQRLLAQNDSKMKKYGHKLPEYQKYTIIFHNLLITYYTRLAWPFTIVYITALFEEPLYKPYLIIFIHQRLKRTRFLITIRMMHHWCCVNRMSKWFYDMKKHIDYLILLRYDLLHEKTFC